jgi:peptidoglycan/xylan/chitin deacetylase (PgdA/CDA1 family)
MGVSVTPSDLEAALTFLTTYYTPVRLQDVLADGDGLGLPPRPILVSFDDGYASIREWAAPLCSRFGVPAVLFLSAITLDNDQLAPDNLICYAVNVLGMETINVAARSVTGADTPTLKSLADVFSYFLPSISLAERRAFLDALARLGGINEHELARKASLYLTRKEVCELATSGFEIGNHTYSHVHCRTLTDEGFCQEIDRNKAELEAISGRKVRSFSVPYGSSADLTTDISRHLRLSGHKAVFLSEGVANRGSGSVLPFDRVSCHADSDEALFSEIELLPRLRAMRDQLFGVRHGGPRRGWNRIGAH